MRWTLVALVLAFLFSGWSLKAEEGAKAKAAATKVDVKDLPKAVTDAATAAAPGIELTTAMMREKEGVKIYKLSGTVGEKKQELMIDETGKVLKSGAKGETDYDQSRRESGRNESWEGAP